MKQVTDARTQAELETAFRSNWWDARTLARRSVEAAWRAGEALAELKSRLPHGDWMRWLETEAVTESTSRRLRRLATVPLEQLVEFDTVSAALKSLPAPTPPAPERRGSPEGPSLPDGTAEAAGGGEEGRLAPPVDPPPAALPDRQTESEIEREVLQRRVDEADSEIADLRERAAIQGEAGEGGAAPHKSLSERFERLQADYHSLRAAHERSERRLGAIRRDLLAGKGTAEVLALHFGLRATGGDDDG